MENPETPLWMAALKANPLKWLLQKNNPSVRYLTLTQLLDRRPGDAEVREAKEAIWDYPPVRTLLQALEETPLYFPGIPFQSKYVPRDLDTLVHFGVPGDHPAVQNACERWLNIEPLPGAGCYPEQMIGGLIRYANIDDPRLQGMIEFVVRNQPFADGNRPGALRYGSRGSCCGSHSCFSAVARSLWAIAGVPVEKRTPEVRDFLRGGAAFLADHRLYKSNHHGFKPIRKEWLKLHLPFSLGWRTDVLNLLDVATVIGLQDDPSVVDALRFLISSQNRKGRWILEQRLENYEYLLLSRIVDVETEGEESKWITLAALTQLKRCEKLVTRICCGEEFESSEEPPEQLRFADYPFPYDVSDEMRVREEWDGFGMQPLLETLLRFADANGLQVGWRWGFVMGPRSCPEWCAAQVRWIPRKGDKKSWPVCRIFFMARREQFTVEELSNRLKISPEDEQEKDRFNKFFWNSLWRIRMEKWKGEYEEIAVTLRDFKEFARLRDMMQEALECLEGDC